VLRTLLTEVIAQEAGEAFSDPKAVAAKQKWESFGAAKSVMVKMQTY
jgi:hypothetical protein